MNKLTDAELEGLRGHTPGPWASSQFSMPLHDDDEWRASQIAAHPTWREISSEFDAAYQRIYIAGHVGEVNARLIASAPALLAEVIERRARDAVVREALQKLVMQWRHNAQGCSRHESHAAGTWRGCARDLESTLTTLQELQP